jgi:hypothetical protein
MRCVVRVPLSRVRVVRGLFMVARLVMFRSFTMVPGGMFVVLGSFVMMFRSLFRHFVSS